MTGVSCAIAFLSVVISPLHIARQPLCSRDPCPSQPLPSLLCWGWGCRRKAVLCLIDSLASSPALPLTFSVILSKILFGFHHRSLLALSLCTCKTGPVISHTGPWGNSYVPAGSYPGKLRYRVTAYQTPKRIIHPAFVTPG